MILSNPECDAAATASCCLARIHSVHFPVHMHGHEPYLLSGMPCGRSVGAHPCTLVGVWSWPVHDSFVGGLVA